MYDEQEQHEDELNAELASFERQLAGALIPLAPRIDRDRLMFEAGRATAQQAGPTSLTEGRFNRSHSFWPIATLTMTAATLLLATTLAWQNHVQKAYPSQQAVAPVATVVAEVTDEMDSTGPKLALARNLVLVSPDSGFPAIRYVALTRGLSALDQELSNSRASLSRESHSRYEKPVTARD